MKEPEQDGKGTIGLKRKRNGGEVKESLEVRKKMEGKG
jgi:hypothetical protein